ncbi:MAG: protein-tyrosine kinase [Lachnospiraceae bacterium]|nr:protein-tyrosine kinase [Lachnospiraceae bacterium]
METNTQIQTDEIEIDLVELLGVLMSKLWIIIIFMMIGGVITFLISVYVIVPQYISTTKMYIINRQSSETLTYSDLQTGTQLTKDYQELVVSRPVLEEVREKLSLPMDNKELKSKIDVSVPTDTRIVTITVEDSSPEMARAIADEIRNSASLHISAVMNTEAVNVVEEADLPLEPSSPKIVKNTVIGAAVGVFIAIVIVVLVYIMDDTIKNPDDIEQYLKVSVLGSIPYDEEDSDSEDEKRRNRRAQKAKKEKKKREKSKSETSSSDGGDNSGNVSGPSAGIEILRRGKES